MGWPRTVIANMDDELVDLLLREPAPVAQIWIKSGEEPPRGMYTDDDGKDYDV